MGYNISPEIFEAIEGLFTPTDKIRVYLRGMVYEADPIMQTPKPREKETNLLTFFDYILRLKPLMSYESLSNALSGEIRRGLRGVETQNQKQDLLANTLSALTLEQVTNLANSGIGISFLDGNECCWAIKEMDSFVMEVHDDEYGGRWKFPPCTLGIPIYSPNEPELVVYILHPQNYRHPFRLNDGAICAGSFADSRSLRQIAELSDFCTKLINLFNYAESILVSGYRLDWDVEPAIGIYEPIFDKYLI